MCESFSYRSLTAFESIGFFPLTVTVDAPFSRNVSPKGRYSFMNAHTI